jgi:hypothetical protein
MSSAQYCSHHTAHSLCRTYSFCIIVTFYPLTNISPFPTTFLFPETTIIIFAFYISVTVLGYTYKIIYYILFCVLLILLKEIYSKFIHVVTNGRISFFTKVKYFIAFTYHMFSIHSHIDGHLDLIYILNSVNHATTSVGVHMYLNIFVQFPLDIYLKVGLLEHMV